MEKHDDSLESLIYPVKSVLFLFSNYFSSKRKLKRDNNGQMVTNEAKMIFHG